MTKEELLQEFLEASKIDKEDIAFYGRFTSLNCGDKTYEGVEALYIELKAKNSYTNFPPQLTYFHHPTTVRLKQ